MENTTNKTKLKEKEKKPEVVFNNCKTYGDNIKALVNYYLGASIGTFVLERAKQEINAKEKELEAFKEKLIKNEFKS